MQLSESGSGNRTVICNNKIRTKAKFKSDRRINMEKYVCSVCGYVYDPAVGDPDNGVEPGTAWEDVPEEWVCPLCGVGKDSFEAE